MLMAAVIVLSKFNASIFLPIRDTGMPIITTVSIASAGWLFHQVSVLARFSLRTFRFGSAMNLDWWSPPARRMDRRQVGQVEVDFRSFS